MADFVTDVTLTAENALQFTFNTPNRVVTMIAGSEIIVKDKLSFIQVHNKIFQSADVDASNLQTINGVAFTGTHADLLSQVQAMAETSNGGLAGSVSGAGVETWVYKNSDYTPTAKLTLSHNTFTETVISDNVDLLDKTEATDAHDGSKYVFAENDMVQVSLNVKIDANTSANLLRFKVRSKDGNYTIRQAHADTNVQQFGQILTFHFTPFAVNAGTASAGFDITVSGFTSTADAFIYNIQQIIQKVGEKV